MSDRRGTAFPRIGRKGEGHVRTASYKNERSGAERRQGERRVEERSAHDIHAIGDNRRTGHDRRGGTE